MVKEYIIHRLKELKEFEKIEFIVSGISFVVYTNSIINNVLAEFVIANCVDDGRIATIPYHAIIKIAPYLS